MNKILIFLINHIQRTFVLSIFVIHVHAIVFTRIIMLKQNEMNEQSIYIQVHVYVYLFIHHSRPSRGMRYLNNIYINHFQKYIYIE